MKRDKNRWRRVNKKTTSRRKRLLSPFAAARIFEVFDPKLSGKLAFNEAKEKGSQSFDNPRIWELTHSNYKSASLAHVLEASVPCFFFFSFFCFLGGVCCVGC